MATSPVERVSSTSPPVHWSAALTTRPIFIRLCVGNRIEADYSSAVESAVLSGFHSLNTIGPALRTAHATASSLQSLSLRAKRSAVEEARGLTKGCATGCLDFARNDRNDKIANRRGYSGVSGRRTHQRHRT